MENKTLFLLILLLTFPLTTAAHWIVGYVEDALDGTSPNGRTIKLYNSTNLQEIFTTVGPSGPSGVSNIYMIDCEMLTIPCVIGNILNLTLTDDATGHLAKQEVQVTVTGAGYDMAPNISMNSPINLSNIEVDDIYTSPENEIDLTPNATTQIFCTAIASDYDQASSITNASAVFYASTSNPTDPDDNNDHYTNSSCEINTSYGTALEAQINCSFQIQYYTNSDNWQCQINATDNASASVTASDSTFINQLLSIGVNSTIDFGVIDPLQVTQQEVIEIINYGNAKINISLSGYGETQTDGDSMICFGENISIEHTKYNMTGSSPGAMTLAQTETLYTNLTSAPVTEEFNMNSRQNDTVNEAKNNTYWRVYVPQGVAFSCQGHIVLGASVT
jgi:hypothetical protein